MLILMISVIVGTLSAQDGAWRVTGTRSTEIRAGMGAQIALLSPDGTTIAHLGGPDLCLYDVDTFAERWCRDLGDDMRGVDRSSLRWSPDSRYLAATEDFFRMFRKPSIWLVEAETGSIRNLTPLADEDVSMGGDTWPDLDLLPTFDMDGDTPVLYFLRLMKRDDVELPPTLYRFDDLDGEPVEVGPLHDFGMLATYGMDIRGDTIAYNVYIPNNDEVPNGAWVQSLTGAEPALRIVEPPQPNLPVIAVSLSPDGRYALATDARLAMMITGAPEETPVSLIDLASSETLVIDPAHFVYAAGWNPDGTALAYLVFNGREADDNGLYITTEAGTPGTRVLDGDFVPSSSLAGQQPLVWSSQNTLLIAESGSADALLVTLAQD
jgi:hypothetical protein